MSKCYVQRAGSIMTSVSHEKMIKKVDDMLIHYDFLIDSMGKSAGNEK